MRRLVFVTCAVLLASACLLAQTAPAATPPSKPADKPAPRPPAAAGQSLLPADTPIELALETRLNTRDLKYGDGFAARVVKPVYYQDKLVVPEGSIVEGRVLLVRDERPVAGSSELMLRPDLLSTPSGQHFVISAAVIENDPLNPAKSDDEGGIKAPRGLMTADVRHAEIGGGAGLLGGALVSGAEGAVVGAGIGAAVAAGIWLARVRHIELNPGSRFTVRLDRPMQLQPAASASAASGAQP